MKSATVRKLKTKKHSAMDQSLLTDTVPAALVGYRNLNSLRYDYPLILTRGTSSPVHDFLFSLSAVID